MIHINFLEKNLVRKTGIKMTWFKTFTSLLGSTWPDNIAFSRSWVHDVGYGLPYKIVITNNNFSSNRWIMNGLKKANTISLRRNFLSLVSNSFTILIWSTCIFFFYRWRNTILWIWCVGVKRDEITMQYMLINLAR